MSKKWQFFKTDQNMVEDFSRQLKLDKLSAKILLNRGVKTKEAAEIFLRPRLNHLSNPLEIPDMQKAAERVLLAKKQGEKIVVYGDYDVDGVTGTAILVHVLKYLGFKPEYYIPHRYGEGYSLSQEAVKKLSADQTKLIITVDCGISSVAEVELANQLGLEVIVTDHHNIPDKLPPAYALVNPKLIAQEHAAKYLSGAGVAFKFAWALLKVAGKKDVEFLTSLLDLAALGTFADVVPLTQENRIIAVNGLKLINDRQRLGVKHLSKAAALKDQISERQVYFALAPRINAAGRIEHASKSVDLLISNEEETVADLALELNQINVRRRGIGSDIKDEVFAKLEGIDLEQKKVVVLAGEDWHPGVIGIVASRVVDQTGRPAVLIGLNEGVGRGSARSIGGVNIYQLLDSCKDLFLDFGGHEGAAGFEISADKIDELKSRLHKAAEDQISSSDLQAIVQIEAEVEPANLMINLAKELEKLAPFGEGNEQPILITRQLVLQDVRQVGKDKRHLKLKLAKGSVTLEAIGFGLGHLADKLSYRACRQAGNTMYDVVYNLETNVWNGFERVQLSLIDMRESKLTINNDNN